MMPERPGIAPRDFLFAIVRWGLLAGALLLLVLAALVFVFLGSMPHGNAAGIDSAAVSLVIAAVLLGAASRVRFSGILSSRRSRSPDPDDDDRVLAVLAGFEGSQAEPGAVAACLPFDTARFGRSLARLRQRGLIELTGDGRIRLGERGSSARERD